jgi:hypothetical protein
MSIMKIETIKAAVDRLRTTECRGTAVNSEALKELRELLSAPYIERKDALDVARDLLARVYEQGTLDGMIGEEIGNFLYLKHDLSVERQDDPFGYWMHPNGLPQLGMFHKPDPDIESASVKEAFVAVRLYAEQPDVVALREELDRYKIAYDWLNGTIENVAAVALRNKEEGELLQQSLAEAEQRNTALEKDRNEWRRRSTHRTADNQEMLKSLMEIERNTTDIDSKKLASKSIAVVLGRAKFNVSANEINVSRGQATEIIEFLYDARGFQREVIERFEESVKHGEGSADNEEHRIGLRKSKIERIEQLQAEIQAHLAEDL